MARTIKSYWTSNFSNFDNYIFKLNDEGEFPTLKKIFNWKTNFYIKFLNRYLDSSKLFRRM